MNTLISVMHIALGLWGLITVQDPINAKKFCRFSAALFGILTICGMLPVLNTVFGLAPLFGHSVWLHAIIAVLTGYFGFTVGAQTLSTDSTTYDIDRKRDDYINKAS